MTVNKIIVKRNLAEIALMARNKKRVKKCGKVWD